MALNRRNLKPLAPGRSIPGNTAEALAHSNRHGEAISLPAGWSGRVLTKRPPGSPTGLGHADLPTVPEWESLLSGLLHEPSVLADYEPLISSNSREVFRARFTWKGKFLNIVCTRRRTKGFWKGLAARWREPRETADFERGLALLRAGISTALPLAIVERKSPAVEGLLVAEFVAGAVGLDEVVSDLLPEVSPGRRHAIKNAMTKAVVELFVSLHRHGLHHGNLKASNIKLTNWESRGEPVGVWLVDLEDLAEPGSANEENRWQPLARLAASLTDLPLIQRSDYCRFLHIYLARAGLARDRWKEHYRALLAQVIPSGPHASK